MAISIHAPHTGRDDSAVRLMINDQYFNPRAPYGARLHDPLGTLHRVVISIHAPHTGRDQ